MAPLAVTTFTVPGGEGGVCVWGGIYKYLVLVFKSRFCFETTTILYTYESSLHKS